MFVKFLAIVVILTAGIAGCQIDNVLLPAIPREPADRWHDSVTFPAPDGEWYLLTFKLYGPILSIQYQFQKNLDPAAHWFDLKNIKDGRSISWLLPQPFEAVKSNLEWKNLSTRLPSPYKGLIYEIKLEQIWDQGLDPRPRLNCYVTLQFDFGE